MGVTRERLAGAVEEVRLHESDSRDIGDLSSQTLATQLLEALRLEPERDQEPLTREQLAKAVDGMEIVVDLLGQDVIPGTWTGAKMRYPSSFATAVFARLGAAPHPPYCCGDPDCGGCHKEPCTHADAGPAPVAGDLELRAIAACMAAVGPLPDSEAGLSSGPVWRVLRYVAERYGYVLCTED